MAQHQVAVTSPDHPAPQSVLVSTGTLLTEAAHQAGIEISQPCGGQGRCGRCAVQVVSGNVRRRSTLRLSPQDVAQGLALACQTVVEGEAAFFVPPQETIERRLTTDRVVAQVTPPADYNPLVAQNLRRISLTLPAPTMDDQRDDWSRLQTALRQHPGLPENGSLHIHITLPLLQRLGPILREADWKITVYLDLGEYNCPECPSHLVAIEPGHVPPDQPLWGVAVDIGTTTVTAWLVNLLTGEVKAQASEYNRQINRGEDVISRIIASGKPGGAEELRRLVVETINELISRVCKRAGCDPQQVFKATIAGNSTMMHLFLGLPADSIRLSPFVTTINHIPTLRGEETRLAIHPFASVDCLPGVASYVGADITAGVLSSGLDETEQVCLFLDVGTNGEIVLGNRDWLATCACSAGPAFEGAGVLHGMRATTGAIEEVWVNNDTYEPTYRVIGGGKPKGLCGSALISLIAELFLTGALDKGGNFNTMLKTPRVRQGAHGWEYVVAWAAETATGEDIVLSRVDVDNLLRAKAAIFAGFSVLANGVGYPLESIEQVLIGGSFGKYINVEKAVHIGLLPDMPWENFQFLGNTSVKGAYYALLDRKARARIKEIAAKMTYLELSADNSFYEEFTSALFLPHTNLGLFPTVAAELEKATATRRPDSAVSV